MTRNGEILIECVTKGCYATFVYDADRKASVDDTLRAEGWSLTPHGDDICPDCVEEAANLERRAHKTA